MQGDSILSRLHNSFVRHAPVTQPFNIGFSRSKGQCKDVTRVDVMQANWEPSRDTVLRAYVFTKTSEHGLANC